MRASARRRAVGYSVNRCKVRVIGKARRRRPRDGTAETATTGRSCTTEGERRSSDGRRSVDRGRAGAAVHRGRPEIAVYTRRPPAHRRRAGLVPPRCGLVSRQPIGRRLLGPGLVEGQTRDLRRRDQSAVSCRGNGPLERPGNLASASASAAECPLLPQSKTAGKTRQII